MMVAPPATATDSDDGGGGGGTRRQRRRRACTAIRSCERGFTTDSTRSVMNLLEQAWPWCTGFRGVRMPEGAQEAAPRRSRARSPRTPHLVRVVAGIAQGNSNEVAPPAQPGASGAARGTWRSDARRVRVYERKEGVGQVPPRLNAYFGTNAHTRCCFGPSAPGRRPPFAPGGTPMPPASAHPCPSAAPSGPVCSRAPFGPFAVGTDG